MRKSSLPHRSMLVSGALALITLGTSMAAAQAQQGAEDPTAVAQMKDAEGNSVGTVQVKELAHGTLFVVDLKNLPSGGHGFHVHEHGRCEPLDFKSAGGHYSPLDNKHGFDNEQGHHAGDLPNVHVTEQGTAKAEFFVHRFVLGASADSDNTQTNDPIPVVEMEEGPFPLLDQDGSAIMIHQNADDYEAVPPDSAGPRIACGVIQEAG